MKLTKLTKKIAAFAAFWGAVALILALILAHPEAFLAFLAGACISMLLVTSWQMIGSFIDG